VELSISRAVRGLSKMKGLAIYTLVIIGLVMFYGIYDLLVGECSWGEFLFTEGLLVPVIVLASKVIARSNHEGNEKKQVIVKHEARL